MKRLHYTDFKPLAASMTSKIAGIVSQDARLKQSFDELRGLKKTSTFNGRYPEIEFQTKFAAVMMCARMLMTENDCRTVHDAVDRMQSLAAFYYFHACPPAKIYKIASHFGHVLKAAPCNVSKKYLDFKVPRLFCIEFPDGMHFDLGDGDFGRCAYVFMNTSNSIFSEFSKEDAQSRGVDVDNIPVPEFSLDIMVPLYTATGEMVASQYVARLRLFGDDDLDSQLKAVNSNELTYYVLKCILYIDSGDPDLTDFKPEPKPHGKKIKAWRLRNEFEVPVMRVGYNFNKPITYTKDETVVSGHWRRQPYGPGLEKVKLIFINEHIRHFERSQVKEVMGFETESMQVP